VLNVDATAAFQDGEGDDEKGAASREGGCRCGRSKCLKQYCLCFRNDVRCTPQCRCEDCHNDGDHEKERICAIRHIRRNRATAFSGTALEAVDVQVALTRGSVKTLRGCRCRRSRCLQKYCECFGAGLRCTTNCVCVDCENGNMVCQSLMDDALLLTNDAGLATDVGHQKVKAVPRQKKGTLKAGSGKKVARKKLPDRSAGDTVGGLGEGGKGEEVAP